MTHLEKLYRELAANHNITVADVERICRFQFSFARDVIASGKFQRVRLPFLGSFSPIASRISKKKDWAIKKNFHAFGFHCC